MRWFEFEQKPVLKQALLRRVAASAPPRVAAEAPEDRLRRTAGDVDGAGAGWNFDQDEKLGSRCVGTVS